MKRYVLILLSGVFATHAFSQTPTFAHPSRLERGNTSKTKIERIEPGARLGSYVRSSIIETGMKYPAIRVRQEWSGRAQARSAKRAREEEVVADHVIVRLKEGATEADLDRIAGRYHYRIRKAMRTPGYYLVAFDAPTFDSVEVAAEVLKRESQIIAAVEPDIVIHLEATPDDHYFGSLWGMNQANDKDIDAPEAWDICTGSDSVTVAVIDTGIDYTHPDIAPNYISGGYDFYNNDSDPMDDHGHGTHCAGIIGAVGNNGIGVAGVCWNIRIMAVKFMNSEGSGYLSDAIDAINYAVNHGADILNNSWGGGGYMATMKNAIDNAMNHGVLFVAAAGNDNNNHAAYPAAYDSSNIIAVAATDENDRLAEFSNYNAFEVDLGAPGVNILSTVTGGKYAVYNGTSMACPYVAGACALVKAAHPSFTWEEIRDRVLGAVDHVGELDGRTVTGGRLNLYHALTGDGGQPVHDSWDPRDDTGAGASALGTIDSTQRKHGPHNLSSDDQYDWFAAFLEEGGVYNFNTSGGSRDTYGELFTDADGNNQVAYDDDAAGNWMFSLTYTAQVSRLYYLRVRHYTVGNNAAFYLSYRKISAAAPGQNWGWNATVPVPGDYDGDGESDLAVYWPESGNWYIHLSATGTILVQNWGWSAALPVPGDYDGDDKTDIAVYWPEGGKWYILSSASQQGLVQSWGWSEVDPVPDDYDGDGKTDIAVYWQDVGNWFVRKSIDGSMLILGGD